MIDNVTKNTVFHEFIRMQNWVTRKKHIPIRDKDRPILLYSIQDVTINNVGTAENSDQLTCIMIPTTIKLITMFVI
jgi:hypothetical protein